jgi:hypothetical protein
MTDPGLILLIGLVLVMIITAVSTKLPAMSKPLKPLCSLLLAPRVRILARSDRPKPCPSGWTTPPPEAPQFQETTR